MSEIKVSKLTNRAGTGAPDFSQGVKIEGTASTLLAPTRTEQSGSGDGSWSVALGDVSYDSVSYSVSSQGTSLRDVAFNSDGTKMYMLEYSNKAIYQYSLSTEFDVSTASYDSVSLNVNSQNSAPVGIVFNSDGTKIYVAGLTGSNIYQYSLSTAYDLSTASYDSVSLNVNSTEGSPKGLAFNTDGTKMYMVGYANDSAYQYSLSTGFDLSTASYDSVSIDLSSQVDNPFGLAFNTDGTKMYVLGFTNDTIYQYGLSTGFDLSTASYDSVSFSVSSQDGTPRGMALSSDGTKLYIAGDANNAIFQYSTGVTASSDITYPENPSNGDTFYDTDNDTYDVYINDEWKRFIGESSGGGASIAWGGDRAVILGGYNTSSSIVNNIEYYDITTTGNASDFGDCTAAGYSGDAAGSTSRTLHVVGRTSSGEVNTIEYITPSATGNASDFGDLSAGSWLIGAHSDGSRALWGGGRSSNGSQETKIEYSTVDTTGNSSDFGDLGTGTRNPSAAGDATYGLFAGIGGLSNNNTIEYVTVQTTGNASDFGDLVQARYGGETGTGLSNATYSLFGGGYASGVGNLDNIDYVTTATTGNATDFGNLGAATTLPCGTANGNYGTFNGGNPSARNKVIEYVTIDTPSNATDFGDLSVISHAASAGSGAAS